MRFLKAKAIECELGSSSINFKDQNGNQVSYSCNSKNKTDFANKIKTHVNNHICKNIYRSNRGCMELTGGYLEETITVDVNTGKKSCAIYIRLLLIKISMIHLGNMVEHYLRCQNGVKDMKDQKIKNYCKWDNCFINWRWNKSTCSK